MILHLYFARRFLVTWAVVFAGFAAMLLLFDLVDQLRRFDGADVSFAATLGLTLLHIPESLYRILPLVTILATLMLFLRLARTSELVIARASGRSAMRALRAPLAVALLIGIVAVTVFNPIVAGTTRQYEAVVAEHAQGRASALSVSRDGLWLRQGDPGGQTVIRAARANLDGTELYDVTFMQFTRDGAPRIRVRAEAARLTPNAWVLTEAKRWDLTRDNPELGAEQVASLRLDTSLTRNQILDSFGTPSSIPIWDLPGFIAGLQKAGFSARKHKVWLQMELSLPLILVAMVLVGASFTMRHTRFGRTGLMVLLALGLGFSLYFIRNFAQVLGENGQIPIALATWGPPVAAILLPMGPLLHWEDG